MNATIRQRLNELPLSDAARQLLAAADAPRQFVCALQHQGLESDALRVLPHMLPHRVSVWWGCLCVWDAQRSQPNETHLLAIESVVRWVLLPSETLRRTCEHFGRALGPGVSPGALALAAFWSGGSMSAPDLPHVAPPVELTSQVIGSVLHMAAVERDPLRFADHYRQYLAIGLEVAAGRLLWTVSGTTADRPANARPPLDASQVSDNVRILHTRGHRLNGPHATASGIVTTGNVDPSLPAHEVL